MQEEGQEPGKRKWPFNFLCVPLFIYLFIYYGPLRGEAGGGHVGPRAGFDATSPASFSLSRSVHASMQRFFFIIYNFFLVAHIEFRAG